MIEHFDPEPEPPPDPEPETQPWGQLVPPGRRPPTAVGVHAPSPPPAGPVRRRKQPTRLAALLEMFLSVVLGIPWELCQMAMRRISGNRHWPRRRESISHPW